MRPELLVVGLGNPGKKYSKSRHNVGFIVCDLISEFFELKFRFGPGNTLVTDYKIAESTIAVAKPLSFMNRSGNSIIPLLKWFDLRPDQMLVICDDFSLPLGTIRIRKQGSAGTHNGLQSIVDNLNTVEFPRIRIGIGVDNEMEDWVEFVLGNFKGKELKMIKKLGNIVIESISSIVVNGIDKSMTSFNKQYEY